MAHQLRIPDRDDGDTTPPIIDSHIHLYTAADIPSLAWSSGIPEGHVLKQASSVAEYMAAVWAKGAADASSRSHNEDASPNPRLRGFVFIETDRVSGLDESEWQHVLAEAAFVAGIAGGDADGASATSTTGSPPRQQLPEPSSLVLGIIPWAPVPAGPEVLSRYIERVRSRCGVDQVHLIKGVRYLVQDKPAGTMVQRGFVESLKWLGAHGLTFDLGVDARQGGLDQLREACEMLAQVYDDEEEEEDGGSGDDRSPDKVRVIINHCCKPNLRLSAAEAVGGHPDFEEWKACIRQMARCGQDDRGGATTTATTTTTTTTKSAKTYIKLSGLFSELPPQRDTEGAPQAGRIDDLVTQVRPWVDAVFDAFGAARIMFGSDWPVCCAGGPGRDRSWRHWRDLVAALMADRRQRGLVSSTATADADDDDEIRMVWAGTAARAYGL